VNTLQEGLANLPMAVKGIEYRDAVGAQTTASPSNVNERARSLIAALAIAGKRSVQS
jgi:hypothetical protein